ncbi:MAG: zinc ribbon domain-containing protein [Methanoregula sp.]|nr:zinc ribbon domain-containing protein [Methanoregula sp.]
MADNSMPDNPRQICPQCNSPVAPGKKFCESCGAKIDAPFQCSHCGAPASPGKKFCESCGAPIEVTKEEKQPEVLPEVTAQDQVTTIARDLTKSQHPLQPPTASDQKKTIPAMTLAIIGIVILIVLVLGAYVVVPVLSGTGPSQKSGDSIAGLVIPTSSTTQQASSQPGRSTLVTGTLTPGPTDIVPSALAVNFQAERDPISGIVTVTFTGGAGQNGVREVVSRLTRSDDQVITKTFTLTQMGKSETLQGTKMTDRIEVIVNYYNGDQYTVLDQTFEYKKR